MYYFRSTAVQEIDQETDEANGLKQIPRLWGVACSTDFDPEGGGGIRNDLSHTDVTCTVLAVENGC